MAASSHVPLVGDACLDPSIIRKILDNGNNHATHAANPIQALKLLDVVNDVKLILTDYHMPNMFGFDLLKDVKESTRLEHIPVVIFFNDYTPDEFAMCLNAGAIECLRKPVNVVDVPRILSYIS